MEKAIFWSCQLSAECRKASWAPCEDSEEEDDWLQIQQSLQLSHATLGDTDADAAADSRNLVTVYWNNEDGTQTEPVALCSLTPGCSHMIKLNFMQSTVPVTFQLASGKGPVYVIGSHRMAALIPEGYESGMSEEEDAGGEDVSEDDEAVEGGTPPPAKKQKKSVHFSNEKQVKTISVTNPASVQKKSERSVTEILTAPLDDYADDAQFDQDDSSLLAPADSDDDDDDEDGLEDDSDEESDEHDTKLMPASSHKATPHPSGSKKKCIFPDKKAVKGATERGALFQSKKPASPRYFNAQENIQKAQKKKGNK